MVDEIQVRVADFQAARGDAVLVTLSLGSCVAVLLHDPAAGVGGMAHLLLPSPSLSRAGDNPGRFPQAAVPALLERMRLLGAEPGRVVGRLVGGASMFTGAVASGTMHMGDRNVIAAREVLNHHAIPVVAEAVGGTQGRSVWFHVGEGRIVVRRVMELDQLL